jgi:hypothetical protein
MLTIDSNLKKLLAVRPTCVGCVTHPPPKSEALMEHESAAWSPTCIESKPIEQEKDN